MYDVIVTLKLIVDNRNSCDGFVTQPSPPILERSLFARKMFKRSKLVLVLLFMIFTVSITVSEALVQEQTFERVKFMDGKLIKSILVRSIRTCVDSCLQLCECRYVRFTKSSKLCQVFEDVLLYYGSSATPPFSDEVDFKKVLLRLFKISRDKGFTIFDRDSLSMF